MSSISKINDQLVRLGTEIDSLLDNLPFVSVQNRLPMTQALEHCCRAQRALIETQVVIFVEAQETDLDIPTLPLFCEERNETDDEEIDGDDPLTEL